MQIIEHQQFDAERALYGSSGLTVRNCRFDGPADGESALKESRNIVAERCFFNLRYPFWHNHNLTIRDGEMTEQCRAALWYSEQVHILNTKLYGIKAVRECQDVTIEECDIRSPEFGWSTDGIRMTDSTAQSEYFLMRAKNVDFSRVTFQGKYSFQYMEHGAFANCQFDTKDAFWHAKNIVIRDSVVKGEYLAWYSDGLTFLNCRIIGAQPFCYCKNLKLVNCEMLDTDLCFEKSEVEAVITTPVISIKNPRAGTITVPSVSEIILDDPDAKGQIKTIQPDSGACA